MPSSLNLPSPSDHLRVSADAIRGRIDQRSDTREGAVYEFGYGPSAMLFTQQASRDRDMFRAVYFSSAEGNDLTRYVRDIYGIERTLDTYGEGTAILKRATAGAGAGTIWAGTRIRLSTSATSAQFYTVLEDVAVGASELTANVKVRALTVGPGAACDTTTSAIVFDTLWDATWQVARLTCAEGTLYEDTSALRARARQSKLENRVGYIPRMRKALLDAGASRVAFFPSDYNGSTDFGINAIYVGDINGNASDLLVRNCKVALESVRVLGCDAMVLPMAKTALALTAVITLASNPGDFDLVAIAYGARAYAKAYLTDPLTSAVYKIEGFRGAISRAHPGMRDINITAPGADATLSSAAWPAILPQYFLADDQISLTFQGPN